jgi:triphosphatase
MRVALRRLRACLSFVRRRFPGAPALEAGSARARALATALGEARDWDVFREHLDEGPRERLNEEPSFYALLDAVELRRARAYEAARALVAAPATRRFVLDLRQAATHRAWRENAAPDKAAPDKAAHDMEPSDAPGSARVFAARTLDRLHRRAVKKCDHLADLAPAQRHEARIALKKTRYAAEFFESLFDAPRATKKYLRAIAKIQDCLGADNDLTTADRLIRSVSTGDDDKTALAAGFVRGWQAHAQQARLAQNHKNERIARRLEPFWR